MSDHDAYDAFAGFLEELNVDDTEEPVLTIEEALDTVLSTKNRQPKQTFIFLVAADTLGRVAPADYLMKATGRTTQVSILATEDPLVVEMRIVCY